MASALWDLLEKQKLKGLAAAMRQTLLKLEKSGQADSRWFNAMGELAVLERNYTVAARYFQQAMDEKGNPVFQLNLGNAHFSAGHYGAAQKVLEAYMAKYPEDTHVLINLANCHLQLGDWEKAKALCDKGLGQKVGKAPLWNCLGQIAFLQGDLPGAWERFDRAYAESPEYVDPLFNRANVQFRQGRVTEALRDYQQCLRKDENFEPALQNMAVIHLEEGQTEEAKACIARALRLSPNSAENHYLLGRTHLAAKDFRLARDALRIAVNLAPDHIPSLLAQAKLHVLESEVDEARGHLRRILASKTLSGDERLAVFTLLLEVGEHGACLPHLERIPAAELTPQLRLIRILCLWKTGKVREAIQELEVQLQARGETAEILTLLGKMLVQTGAPGLAETRLRRALELDATASGAAFELAQIHLQSGEGDRAVTVLTRLLATRPNDPDCLYNLACCHAKNRNFDECLHFLKQALEHGFQDFGKISGDEDLAAIRQLKEFAQLTGQAGLT